MIYCPYHGPRPPTAAGECSACRSGASILPMAPFTPLAPLIAAPKYPAATPQLSKVTYSVAPAQHLLATSPTALLTIEGVLPLIHARIAELERAMAAAGAMPLGPLILLYDHPDVSDFEHFRFGAAYPIAPVSTVPPGLDQIEMPAHCVASIQFAGPWSMLHLAYPPLRSAIVQEQARFGRFTFERYVIPRGTNAPDNVTAVQRQIDLMTQ